MKGRSGRKTLYDELLIAEVVNLSLKTVRDYIKDEKISIDKKVLVAQHFGVKAMPQKLEGLNFTEYNYTVNKNYSVAEKPQEFTNRISEQLQPDSKADAGI